MRLAAWRAAKLEEQNAGARDGKKGDSTSSHNEERVFLPDHRLLVLFSSASASDQHLAPPTTVLPTPSAPSISPSCFAEVQPLNTVDELWAWAPNPTYLPPSSYTLPLSRPPSSPSSPSSSSSSFISGQGRRVGGEGGREGGRDRSRLLVCHDLEGGYLGDRHCFGLSCPWGEGGREEGGRDGAEAAPEVEAGVVSGEHTEKGAGEEGRGDGLGVGEQKEGESEAAAKGTQEKAALTTAAALPPPFLAPAFRLHALDLCDTLIYFSHHLIAFPHLLPGLALPPTRRSLPRYLYY